MEKIDFMKAALEEARIAFDAGDVPVGAVVVREGEIISRAHNEREASKNAVSHAEILAISRACERLGRWRLSDCELYVTLEPCPMCAGAILNSRLSRVCYALKESKTGALGSVLNMNSYPLLYKVAVEVGPCEDESRKLIGDFFKRRRSE